MDRSKDADPQFDYECNRHAAADVIVALSFSSASSLKDYWDAWPHWNKPPSIVLPKGHDLDGYHIVPPND